MTFVPRQEIREGKSTDISDHSVELGAIRSTPLALQLLSHDTYALLLRPLSRGLPLHVCFVELGTQLCKLSEDRVERRETRV